MTAKTASKGCDMSGSNAELIKKARNALRFILDESDDYPHEGDPEAAIRQAFKALEAATATLEAVRHEATIMASDTENWCGPSYRDVRNTDGRIILETLSQETA